MPLRALSSFLLFFIFKASSIYGQVGGIYYGDLIKEGDAKIELWLFPPKVSCGAAAGTWVYKFRTENLEQLDTTKKYLSWKLNTTNCDGFLIKQGFRLQIGDIQSKSNFLKGNSEWVFDARQVEGKPFDIKLSESSRKASAEIVGPKLYPPDSISGDRILTSDRSLTLRVFGPPLPQGAEWVWYKDSCAGKSIHIGPAFTTVPGSNTTYFVRSQLKTFASSCTSFAVLIDDHGQAPEQIISESGFSRICAGSTQPITLALAGGRLGLQARWVWYANKIDPSSQIAAGLTRLDVNPDRTTIYIVRGEGPAGNTTPVSFTLNVIEPSLSPAEIIRDPQGELCEGTLLHLSVEGGRLGEESKWVWTSIKQDGSKRLLGNGQFITTEVDQSAVFMVYADGVCGKTKEAYLDIEIKKNSVNPLVASISSQPLNGGHSFRTSIRGGFLGEGANWIWYRDSLARHKIAEGNNIVLRSGKNPVVYIRAEGDCNQTMLMPYSLPASRNSQSFFFNAGWITNTFRTDSANLSNFFVAAGMRRFYVKWAFGWPELSGNEGGNIKQPIGTAVGDDIGDFPIGNGAFYRFSGKVYPRIQTYTAGYMLWKRPVGEWQIHLLLGGGYGTYDLFREFKLFNTTDGSLKGVYWAKDKVKSVAGPSVESGLFVKWKWFSFMGGINSIVAPSLRRTYLSGFLGAGFTW